MFQKNHCFFNPVETMFQKNNFFYSSINFLPQTTRFHFQFVETVRIVGGDRRRGQRRRGTTDGRQTRGGGAAGHLPGRPAHNRRSVDVVRSHRPSADAKKQNKKPK